jgi:hypothetical protein
MQLFRSLGTSDFLLVSSDIEFRLIDLGFQCTIVRRPPVHYTSKK